jgi:carnitine O-acetyltransferase
MFADAIKSQSSYMKDAASGKGVDRHLLGLRMMIKLEESDKTSFFKDPSFLDSMNFRLSTSNMSPGKNFYGGFGPVVHDGYGINYAMDKDNLKFSISSKVSCQETNSFKFRELIERCLIDLMILFPKRSQVWGYNWKENHAMELKEEYQLTAMRKLSDELKKKQALLAERYRQK